MDTNGENWGAKIMNNGQLWNGASRMMVIKVNVLWVLILHDTIGFVACIKETLSKIKMKKRGIREEEK